MASAQDFFAELESFSAEVRQLYTGSPRLSPYGNPAYRQGQGGLLPDGRQGPAGAILHYTAGGSACSAVRTFCDPTVGNGRSAHVVVERGWPTTPALGPIRARYPAISALTAMPVACRLFTSEGVHATWANRWSLGVEVVSWGKLAPENASGPVVSAWGARWQAIGDDQVSCVAAILRQAADMFPSFSPARVFSHEQVQTPVTPGCGGENKIDTGPILDVLNMRRLLRDPAAQIAVQSTAPRPAVDTTGERMLRCLGYYDGGPIQPPLAVFQFAMGLTPDGLLGPKSKAALAARIRDRMGPDAEGVLRRC